MSLSDQDHQFLHMLARIADALEARSEAEGSDDESEPSSEYGNQAGNDSSEDEDLLLNTLFYSCPQDLEMATPKSMQLLLL